MLAFLKKINKKIVITFSVLLLIIAVLLVLFFNDFFYFGVKTKTVSFDNIDDISTLENSIMLNVDDQDHVYGFNGSILKCQSRKVVWLDKKGKQINTCDSEFGDPIFNSSGDFLVIAENNQRHLSVYKKDKLLWSDELDGDIYNVSINDSGFVCVVRSFLGYESAVEVFDASGKQLFYSCKAHNKIISANVNKENTMVLLHSVSLANVNVVSNLEVLDMKGQVVSTYENSDICLSAKFLNNDNIIMVSNNKLVFFDKDLKVLKEYNDLNISDVALISNDSIALLSEQTDESNEFVGRTILIYNSKGQFRYKLHFDNQISNINGVGKLIGVNFGNTCIIISDKGKIKGGCKAERTINKIMRVDGSHLIVSTNEKIYVCKY